jgi:uncharacterized protein YfaT (DUF1175 family)
LVSAGLLLRGDKPLPPRIAVQPDRLLADGYDVAVLSIDSSSAETPRISVMEGARGVVVEDLTGGSGSWQARVRSGVLPGRVKLRVDVPGLPSATAELTSVLDVRDTAEDGTPDFLRIQDRHDRQAFRRWFTYLAEAQYFQNPSARPAEINDCAALIRYAYREALRAHDAAWANTTTLPALPAFDSVSKYQYPYTSLGAALFRVHAGPFRREDLTNGAFLQFADARTLWRFNTHFVTRDLAKALPGDLLFFRQETNHVTFHSMIYLGESPFRNDGQRYVLYHTGPMDSQHGDDPGEIRRLTVDELMHFPQAEWRPLVANPSFLGVARWNILRKGKNEPDTGQL